MFKWLKEIYYGPDYPLPLETIFKTHRCPDCGEKDWETWQDGGHDISFHCLNCKSNFGVQYAAGFKLIERCGKPWYK